MEGTECTGSAILSPLCHAVRELVTVEGSECSRDSRMPLCSVVSAISTHSAISATPSEDDIIKQCLPTIVGERNRCILDLARGLKFNVGLPNAKAAKPLVRKWHDLALPIIGTKGYEESWSDFINAFRKARHPLGGNLVDVVAMRFDPNNIPEIAMQYESEAVQKLVALCFALASTNGNGGRFWLSSHDAAEKLGVMPAEAWRWLQMLEADGVIECYERGNQRKATRYRWIGDAKTR